MNIAIFTDFFYPHISGVTTSIGTVAAELGRNGHHVHIIAPKGKRGAKIDYKAKNVTLHFTSSFPIPIYKDLRTSFPFSPKMLLELKNLDIDIFHFHTPWTFGFAAIMMARLLNKPVVGTFHGYFMEPEYLKVLGIKKESSKIVTSTLWKYNTLVTNMCDGVITPAESARKDLMKKGVQREITVLNNTIDTEHIKKIPISDVQELKKKLGLKEKVILYVGRVSHEKDIDKLVLSFAEIAKNEKNVSLCIIGDGPAKKSLEKLVAQKKLGNSVVFCGHVDQSDLLQKGYMQTADIFATASVSEVQPISIIEAFFFGLPVVGIAKKGNGEMLQNSGLLSKPGDMKGFTKNLLSLVKNDTLRKELSEKSLREFEEKYELKRTIKKYEEYYRQFIKD